MKKFLAAVVAVMMAFTLILPAIAESGARTFNPPEEILPEAAANPIEAASVSFGFETDPFEEGWTSVDEDGDGYNWEWKSTGGKIDGGCMQSASYSSGALDPDNWLISPPVPGGGYVDFRIAAESDNWLGDKIGIYVKEEGSDTWSDELALYTTEAEPCFCSVNLSVYEGQQIRVAFRHYNSKNIWALQLDDVFIGEHVLPTAINVEDLTVSGNRHAQLVWEVLPAEAFDKSVTFAVENEAVAVVDSAGLVTGMGMGETTVTVTSVANPGAFGTATITVPDMLTDPVLDEALNIEGGGLHFFTEDPYPWVVPEGESYAKSTNNGVGSSASTVSTAVTVNEGDILRFDFQCWGEGAYSYHWDGLRLRIDGNVIIDWGEGPKQWTTYTAVLTAGSHTVEWIYEKDSAGNSTGDYALLDNVYVDPQSVMPEEIQVDPVEVLVGEQATAVYTVLPEDASDKSVTFATEDAAIATVDENGVVTGIAEGETNLIVTSVADPTVSGTATVTVTELTPEPGTIQGFYFETDPELEGWTWEDHDGDEHNWMWLFDPDETEGYYVPEGYGMMYSESCDEWTDETLTPDNWLISPDVPGGGSVSFKYVAQSPYYCDEHIGVYASSDGGASWSDELGYFTTTGNVQTGTVSLEQFAGENIKLAFRHYNSTDQYLATIDAVVVSTEAPPPPPPAGIGYYFELDSDPYAEGWTVEDHDEDTHNWTWMTDPGHFYPEGGGMMYSESYDPYGGVSLTPDNWLISPEISGAISVNFKLLTQDPDYPNENIGVYVSTDGGESWSEELAYFNATAEVQDLSVELSEYAGQNIKVAFRHYDSSDQWAVGLDAVVFPGGEPAGSTPPAGTQLNGYITDNSVLAWGEFNETSPENVLLHDSSPMTYAAAYAGGTVYGFNFHYDLFEGTLDDRFFTMDPDTFEITYPEDAVGSNGAMVYAMAYNHAEGEMYALAMDMMSGTVGVFTVDLALGMPRYKVALDAGFDADGEPITITTLAIDGEGNAYGLSVSDTDSGLYSINLETGVCTLIGQTDVPLPYLQSTTWDHNTDRLFWAQYDDEDGRLYIIDPTDAGVTLCGSIGEGYEVTALWTANNEPVAPIVVSDYSVTFKDGLTDEEIEGGYVVAAGTVLDPEDFPEPPEHEDYEFAAWDYDGKPVYDDIVISAMYRDPNALGFYFEVNPVFEGWTWEDTDGDGFCWQWNLADPFNLYTVPEGEGCMTSFSFCNDTFEPLTPDNWLISPEVPGGGSVSFMLVAQDEGYPDENIGVYASTDGGITWSDELGYFTAAGDVQTFTVDLADFANMSIKLAFRHYDVTDQFCVNLDAVEIATGCEDAVLPEEITVEDMVVSVGETAETVYTVIPDDADDLRVTFAIADESIATVDENGVVTGIAAGETEITVTSVGAPEVWGTATVTVTEPTPPAPPTTGFVSLAGIGIAAILSGAGIVLFRKKRS